MTLMKRHQKKMKMIMMNDILASFIKLQNLQSLYSSSKIKSFLKIIGSMFCRSRIFNIQKIFYIKSKTFLQISSFLHFLMTRRRGYSWLKSSIIMSKVTNYGIAPLHIPFKLFWTFRRGRKLLSLLMITLVIVVFIPLIKLFQSDFGGLVCFRISRYLSSLAIPVRFVQHLRSTFLPLFPFLLSSLPRFILT